MRQEGLLSWLCPWGSGCAPAITSTAYRMAVTGALASWDLHRPLSGDRRGTIIALRENQHNSKKLSLCAFHSMRRRRMGTRISMVDYVSIVGVAAIMVYLWLH